MTPPSKTFRVDARIRNNLLIKAREALGYKSASQAAQAIGVAYGCLVRYESLSDSPWKKGSADQAGQWKSSAIAIATAYKTIPELLWPDEVDAVTNTRVSMEIDFPEGFVLEAPQTPEEKMLEDGRARTVSDAMMLLTPRERNVLHSRFGLGGDEPMTLSGTGDANSVSRERIRQIEIRALRKLRGFISDDGESQEDALRRRADAVREASTAQMRAKALGDLPADHRSEDLCKPKLMWRSRSILRLMVEPQDGAKGHLVLESGNWHVDGERTSWPCVRPLLQLALIRLEYESCNYQRYVATEKARTALTGESK
jgi:hypothetical protein